tara:strand:+ start:1794 stop:2267 length:474 start_codon:yes stop_codon:yes gene_type:complete
MSFINDRGTDNFITCRESWMKIKKYIPNDKIVWSPFYCDGEQKEIFKDMGFDIIHRDEDFFENDKGQIIIDSPPFSKKKEVFFRLKDLDKPFIMIAPSVMLAYKYFQQLFGDELQIIIPLGRINFHHFGSEKKFTPPYGCFFYCWKMGFSKDLIFIE